MLSLTFHESPGKISHLSLLAQGMESNSFFYNFNLPGVNIHLASVMPV